MLGFFEDVHEDSLRGDWDKLQRGFFSTGEEESSSTRLPVGNLSQWASFSNESLQGRSSEFVRLSGDDSNIVLVSQLPFCCSRMSCT